MTNISPIDAGAVGRIPAVEINSEVVGAKRAAKARRGDDRVEVSDAARFLAKLNNMPEIRSELVDRVRNEIANGSYDTPEKFELALDGLIDDAV